MKAIDRVLRRFGLVRESVCRDICMKEAGFQQAKLDQYLNVIVGMMAAAPGFEDKEVTKKGAATYIETANAMLKTELALANVMEMKRAQHLQQQLSRAQLGRQAEDDGKLPVNPHVAERIMRERGR